MLEWILCFWHRRPNKCHHSSCNDNFQCCCMKFSDNFLDQNHHWSLMRQSLLPLHLHHLKHIHLQICHSATADSANCPLFKDLLLIPTITSTDLHCHLRTWYLYMVFSLIFLKDLEHYCRGYCHGQWVWGRRYWGFTIEDLSHPRSTCTNNSILSSQKGGDIASRLCQNHCQWSELQACTICCSSDFSDNQWPRWLG